MNFSYVPNHKYKAISAYINSSEDPTKVHKRLTQQSETITPNYNITKTKSTVATETHLHIQ